MTDFKDLSGNNPSTSISLDAPNNIVRNRDEFLFNVALGRISGFRSSTIVGINEDIDVATEETIWNQGGIVSFLTVPAPMFASSSSAADTAIFIFVVGVDVSWNYKTAFVQLNGQTAVALGAFLHIQSAIVQSGAAVGDIYIAIAGALVGGVPSTASAIKTKVVAGRQTSHNGWLLIPAGKTGMAVAQRISGDDPAKLIEQHIYVHYLGQAPIRFSTLYVAGTISLTFPIPIGSLSIAGTLAIAAPEKTIVEFRATSTGANTKIALGLDFILVDQDEFVIGQ